MSHHKFTKSSGNVFKDLGFEKVEARSLKFRSHLMTMLMRYIKNEGLTQKEAGKRLGITQPRISNLVHGKIDLFSTGMLLDMIERTGFPIYRKIEMDADQCFVSYEGKRKRSGSATVHII